mgnify:FL=1
METARAALTSRLFQALVSCANRIRPVLKPVKLAFVLYGTMANKYSTACGCSGCFPWNNRSGAVVPGHGVQNNRKTVRLFPVALVCLGLHFRGNAGRKQAACKQ